MPLSALTLALVAAAVHAAWNLMLSGKPDTHAATAVAGVAGALLFAPATALTWRLDASAWPYIAASAALELVYFVLLATAYGRAAVGFVYPVARGSAPVLVLVAGAVALGAGVSAVAAAGVALVAAGIVGVYGLRASARPRDLALALAVGGCIAGYTLIDKEGITHGRPLSYLQVVFSIAATGYLAGVWRTRGTAALRGALDASTIVAGAGFFGAYAVALVALRLAPAASVAAVRESSVVMAAAALAVSGRERITASRLCGAVAVAGGVALISLG
jgi:drug/metabolite transporter (DMT)-like permease